MHKCVRVKRGNGIAETEKRKRNCGKKGKNGKAESGVKHGKAEKREKKRKKGKTRKSGKKGKTRKKG